MSKLKAKLDKAIAEDLGIVLASNAITLKDLKGLTDQIECLILAYSENEIIYYDQIPVWRNINGMRIKIPKFHSRPIIEARLTQQLYQRYYALGNGVLTPLKVSKPNDLKLHLPFRIGNDPSYHTEYIIPETMGLRKKPLLGNRSRISYAL